MKKLTRVFMPLSLVVMLLVANGLYCAEVDYVTVIVKNETGGPLKAKVNDSKARITHGGSSEFKNQITPLHLYIASENKSTAVLWHKDVELSEEFNRKYPGNPLGPNENMLVTVTSGWASYIVNIARGAKPTEKTSLQAITNPWQVFVGLNELWQPRAFFNPDYPSFKEIIQEFEANSPERAEYRERIARIMLNLSHRYTKSDLNTQYRRLWLQYHPDKVDQAEKEMARKIFDIISRAKEILENSTYYKGLQ
jgi:hypothetical protein